MPRSNVGDELGGLDIPVSVEFSGRRGQDDRLMSVEPVKAVEARRAPRWPPCVKLFFARSCVRIKLGNLKASQEFRRSEKQMGNGPATAAGEKTEFTLADLISKGFHQGFHLGARKPFSIVSGDVPGCTFPQNQVYHPAATHVWSRPSAMAQHVFVRAPRFFKRSGQEVHLGVVQCPGRKASIIAYSLGERFCLGRKPEWIERHRAEGVSKNAVQKEALLL